MIIEEGQSEFDLPEPISDCQFGVYSHGDPEQNPQSVFYRVAIVSPSEILQKSQDERALRGIPTMFTIVGAIVKLKLKYKLLFWPASDKKTVGRLEYMPAPKVL